MKAFFVKIHLILKAIYKPILTVAHFIGKVNSFIILTIFYFLFLGTARICSWILRKDLLDLRFRDRETYWKLRKDFTLTRASLLEPY